MTKLIAAFALGVIVTALIAFATQGRIETKAGGQIAPSEMMKGQHPPQAEFTDYSVVFPP